jgi:pimeloyl-ACP methyl ester carboxylesterase
MSPLARRAVYLATSTRSGIDEPTYSLDTEAITLRGWVVNPGQRRALVYFGGNNEEITWLRPHFASMAPGHTCYLLAYRGYGASGGRPTEAALTRDAVTFHDDVESRHPGLRVDVFGRSLGSGVAMQLAARREVGRLALVTPFDSLVSTGADLVPWLPIRSLLDERWDSAAVATQAAAHASDILVLRAGRDQIVRPARTDALLAALPPGTHVIDYPDADHRSIHEQPTYWTSLADFFAG